MSEEDPRILELRALREKSKQGGGFDRIAKQHEKGKMTARERISFLLDPNTFSEMEAFAVQMIDPQAEQPLGDGVVTGFGSIDGRTVYIYAQDFTIQGGSLGQMQSRKICRIMDLAVQAGAPVIGMIDSGGARIQEGVHSLSGYAEIFRRNSLYSGIIPQISVIMGPCACGAAYSPALTDLIIMVEKQSYMFLTGPEVIKSVTGEIVDSETLGGAETHLSISGLAHLISQSEKDALITVRKVLSYLPSNQIDNPPSFDCKDDPWRMDETLNSIVPIDPTIAYRSEEH